MTPPGEWRRLAVRALAGATFVLSALGPGGATPAMAEPAFAVRTGYSCSQCHVNRTGGGMRTPFGSIYTQTILPSRLLKWRDGGNLLPANPDARLSFGGNLRGQYLAVKSGDFKEVFSFEVPEANLYVEARLAPGRLSVYLDEKVGPGGASARELFGLFSLKKWNGYVKVGKFLPPYGWRLPDDAAFIRQFTGFTYVNPDIGVEFGVAPGRWSAHLAVVNGAAGGSDDNRSKKFTLQTIRRFRKGRVGLSGSNNIRGGTTTTQAGILGGVNFGRLALLAEGDWVESNRSDGTDHRLLGFIEADVLVSRGVNLKLAHDWMDPDLDTRTDRQTRDSIGLELMPIPFVQLRWFFRWKDGPPQIPGARDTQADFEVHIFF